MELLSLETGRVLSLRPGVLTTLGRSHETGISSTSVSRHHCSIILQVPHIQAVSGQESAPDGSLGESGTGLQPLPNVKITVHHASGVAVVRGPHGRSFGGETLVLLPANATCQLHPGDTVYLERRDAKLASGFELRQSSSPGSLAFPLATQQLLPGPQPPASIPPARGATHPADPRVGLRPCLPAAATALVTQNQHEPAPIPPTQPQLLPLPTQALALDGGKPAGCLPGTGPASGSLNPALATPLDPLGRGRRMDSAASAPAGAQGRPEGEAKIARQPPSGEAPAPTSPSGRALHGLRAFGGIDAASPDLLPSLAVSVGQQAPQLGQRAPLCVPAHAEGPGPPGSPPVVAAVTSQQQQQGGSPAASSSQQQRRGALPCAASHRHRRADDKGAAPPRVEDYGSATKRRRLLTPPQAETAAFPPLRSLGAAVVPDRVALIVQGPLAASQVPLHHKTLQASQQQQVLRLPPAATEPGAMAGHPAGAFTPTPGALAPERRPSVVQPAGPAIPQTQPVNVQDLPPVSPRAPRLLGLSQQSLPPQQGTQEPVPGPPEEANRGTLQPMARAQTQLQGSERLGVLPGGQQPSGSPPSQQPWRPPLLPGQQAMTQLGQRIKQEVLEPRPGVQQGQAQGHAALHTQRLEQQENAETATEQCQQLAPVQQPAMAQQQDEKEGQQETARGPQCAAARLEPGQGQLHEAPRVVVKQEQQEGSLGVSIKSALHDMMPSPWQQQHFLSTSTVQAAGGLSSLPPQHAQLPRGTPVKQEPMARARSPSSPSSHQQARQSQGVSGEPEPLDRVRPPSPPPEQQVLREAGTPNEQQARNSVVKQEPTGRERSPSPPSPQQQQSGPPLGDDHLRQQQQQARGTLVKQEPSDHKRPPSPPPPQPSSPPPHQAQQRVQDHSRRHQPPLRTPHAASRQETQEAPGAAGPVTAGDAPVSHRSTGWPMRRRHSGGSPDRKKDLVGAPAALPAAPAAPPEVGAAGGSGGSSGIVPVAGPSSGMAAGGTGAVVKKEPLDGSGSHTIGPAAGGAEAAVALFTEAGAALPSSPPGVSRRAVHGVKLDSVSTRPPGALAAPFVACPATQPQAEVAAAAGPTPHGAATEADHGTGGAQAVASGTAPTQLQIAAPVATAPAPKVVLAGASHGGGASEPGGLTTAVAGQQQPQACAPAAEQTAAQGMTDEVGLVDQVGRDCVRGSRAAGPTVLTAGVAAPPTGYGEPGACAGFPAVASRAPAAGADVPSTCSGVPSAGSGAPEAGALTPAAGCGAPAGGSGAAAAGSRAHGPGSAAPVCGGTGRPAGLRGARGPGSGIFTGCRFVFWDRALVRDILARVKQAGGQEQYSVGPTTTHVVARFDTTEEEAARLLRASDLTYDPGAGAPFALPPGGPWFVTPAFLRDSLARGQVQDSARYQIALATAPASAAPAAPSSLAAVASSSLLARPAEAPAVTPHAQSTRAAGVAGTPAMVASGGGGGRPADTGVPEQQAQRVAVGGGDLRAPSSPASPRDPSRAAMCTRATTPTEAELQSAGRDQGSSGRVLPSPSEICARPEDWGFDDRWIEPWDEEAARRTNQLILSHWNKLRDGHGSDSDHDTGPPGATTPGGGTSGQSGRRRAEPGLFTSRRGTAAHRRRREGVSSGEDEDKEGDPRGEDVREGRDQSPRGGAGGGGGGGSEGEGEGSARTNRVCNHACCAAKEFCIVAELKRTKSLYMGRGDQFRIKAIDRAMGVLVRLDWPLESPDQLKQLHLGKSTEEKVSEILATGRFSRNDLYEHNEQRATMMLFMEVWGCAEGTARKWWSAGCRTLDDVRRRTDLTAQQRLGLQHFEDFQRRIPRDEVSEVARVVRQETIETLRALTHLPDRDLLDRLHVRPMGSYSRGSPSSSDVDFIIAPSPQADPLVAPLQLLVALVGRLQQAGYVDEESARMIQTRHDFRNANRPKPIRLPSATGGSPVAAGRPRPSPRQRRRRCGAGGADVRGDSGGDDGDAVAHESPSATDSEATEGDTAGASGAGPGASDSCTWLGVWRQPSSGRFCRVDIKVYRRPLLPFAVNYFSSGTDFCRALRYWCNWPVPAVSELARRHHPEANAFRLSDKELAVTAQTRGPRGSRATMQEVILRTLPCSCETDIFRAVGLSYVPPHLRDITRVE